ncbi:eamA-like transporter family protein [Burkholderia pseudomallei MSHR3960]|nr:eamA-like transporter family protein [Burkholderia pseudomallei MSHR3960]
MLIICAALGLLRRDLLTKRTIAFALLGSVAIVANWVLLFAAYSRASISMATAVYNTQPFMLVALGALVFRERLTASAAAWLVLAFGGLALVVRVEPAVLAVPGEYLEGVALALGAAFLYAVSSIVTKRLKGTPPHLIALFQTGVGVLALAPFVHYDALPATAGSGSISSRSASSTRGSCTCCCTARSRSCRPRRSGRCRSSIRSSRSSSTGSRSGRRSHGARWAARR